MRYLSKIKRKLPKSVLYNYRLFKMYPKYINAYIRDLFIKYPSIKFYDDNEVINSIINEKKSLCRFGDGEFMWMLNIESKYLFQNCSNDLSRKLIEIINKKNDNLLFGIPKGIIDSSECNLQAKMHWKITKNKYFGDICKMIPADKYYCNASITRPYIDYKEKKYSGNRFNNLRRIWDKKDVVIVEGRDSKLGMGNDLFDNVNSIKRIICPSTNAYERYTEIFERIISITTNELILLSLGPTATILSAELCEKGYQAIDIGHIDIEYMWYLNNAKVKEEIEGKYVGESGVLSCSKIYDDDIDYKKSIIAEID